MRTTSIVVLALTMIAAASPVLAAQSDWMSRRQLNAYADTSKSGRWHPVKIDCKAGGKGPLLRLTTVKTDPAAKPFHKWTWVVGKADELDLLVRKIKLRDRPELKYRIVHKKTYTGKDGVKYACAIVYR